ncbi:MAG: hypothetical protein FWE35_23090 [Streptosporangiales bacterium]|nr:hypothetical protein [Streptosporangiales bacterium]
MTVLREEFHRVVDQLPEKELAPLLDYVRSHAHQPGSESLVWDGPDFVGAFSSGRSDVSERADELLFADEHPTGGSADQ